MDATLLTIEEAARYLGVSKLTLYGWVSQGKITYISNSHEDRRSQVREDVEAGQRNRGAGLDASRCEGSQIPSREHTRNTR